MSTTEGGAQPSTSESGAQSSLQDDIDRFNAAAAQYAAESGKPLAEAIRDLGNLLSNMVNDPVGTELYILKNRVAEIEPLVSHVPLIEDRLTALEEIIGTNVGPGEGGT